MSEQGRKFDGGKLRYDLIPVLALEETAKVVTKGAEKYDDENWKLVPEGRRRYLAAAMRHIQQWRKGEIYDEEMGTHHIANAISNLMFILEKELQGWEDDVEEDDISQEELKGYVTKFVDIETHRSGTITMGVPTYSADGAHTNSIDFSTKLWYPPVEDGGNPWIEIIEDMDFDAVRRDVGSATLIEVLADYERESMTYSKRSSPFCYWFSGEFDNKVAYRIVS